MDEARLLCEMLCNFNGFDENVQDERFYDSYMK